MPRRWPTPKMESAYRKANPNCTCVYDDYIDNIHPQTDCPDHGVVVVSSNDPRRVGVHRKDVHVGKKPKPNHFSNDALGDPMTCTGDHHHPKYVPMETLKESIAELEPDWKTPPEHYQGEGMQPWEVWEAFDLDAWQAAAVKYILRAGKKGPAGPDYIKARNYIEYLINRETK